MSVVKSSGIPFMMLKDRGLYFVPEEGLPQPTIVEFRAEIGYIDWFKVAVAKWTWPDGQISEVKVQPFTQTLLFSGKPLPFEIKYNAAVWYAPLRWYK